MPPVPEPAVLPGPKPYVFLGPTLGHDAAREVLDAEYRPPAAVGDVYRAVCAGAAAILIVDGYFQRVPAVWHKEILYALSRGVAMFGCSSIGALRAVELHRYGMTGIGEVFRAYLAGDIEDDDEVAVSHLATGPDYRRASEAMVDIRFGLRTAAAQELISRATQEWLCTYAKGLFYPDRHWGRLCAAGEREGLPAAELTALAGWVRTVRPSIKARDAYDALRMLAAGGAGSPAPAPFTFEPTNIWYWLQHTEAAPPGRLPEG